MPGIEETENIRYTDVNALRDWILQRPDVTFLRRRCSNRRQDGV